MWEGEEIKLQEKIRKSPAAPNCADNQQNKQPKTTGSSAELPGKKERR